MDNVTLPRCIAPMLARPGKPFDSAEHLFEVKWDGMRASVYRRRRLPDGKPQQARVYTS